MDNSMPPGMRIAVIHRFFRQQLDQRLREQDLTGVQFGVLGALGRLESSGAAEVNQRDLERASHVTHPTMTEIIKRLERKGFISCRQSEADRRNKSISSTQRAKALKQEMAQVDDSVFRLLCRGLDEGQVADFMRLTDVMLDNVLDEFRKGCVADCDKKAAGQCKGV